MTMTDDAPIRHLRRALLSHFDGARRELPWRGEDDPYRIWVSEVMLQQTRVETVVPYYRRWLERFPTVEALAAADREEVLNAWEGLGYYSRARNLHAAARLVRERHDGAVPDDPDALRELPGVGEYTAGAVASIAFDRPEPAVDGNARRVLARLFDLAEPGRAALRELAGRLVEGERPGDLNQAVMELGATICTPRSPDCGACPVEALCAARAAGTVDVRPEPRKRSPARDADFGVAAVVARAPGGGRRLLLRRRQEDGLLGGMWELPGEEAGDGEEPLAVARRLTRAHAPASADLPDPAPLEPVPHAFSHIRARYHPFLWEVGSGAWGGAEPAAQDGGGRLVRWISPDGSGALPLPVAQQKMISAVRRTLDGRDS